MFSVSFDITTRTFGHCEAAPACDISEWSLGDNASLVAEDGLCSVSTTRGFLGVNWPVLLLISVQLSGGKGMQCLCNIAFGRSAGQRLTLTVR
eukprot:scaffold15272_cov64-Cylindrotheca_fusiformis.AAC.1